MRIGVISDTHGLLRPEALEMLVGVDHIIHAGDIGRAGIVETLAGLAPVTAIRGNVDTAVRAMVYPEEARVELGGRMFYVLHDVSEIRRDAVTSGIDTVISGHSHRPTVETKNGVLFLIPAARGRAASGCRSHWRRWT